MRLSRNLCTAIVCTLLASCSASMPPSPPRAQHDPLAKVLFLASCPVPAPLDDDTFGATTLKLLEVAATLAECRATGSALLSDPAAAVAKP